MLEIKLKGIHLPENYFFTFETNRELKDKPLLFWGGRLHSRCHMLVSGSHRLQSAPTLLWFMICLENTRFSQRICFIQEWLSIREPGEPGGDHPRRQARRVGYFLFRCSNKLVRDSGLGSIGYHGVTNPHPNHLHPFTLLGNSYSAFRRGSVLMCPEI